MGCEPCVKQPCGMCCELDAHQCHPPLPYAANSTLWQLLLRMAPCLCAYATYKPWASMPSVLHPLCPIQVAPHIMTWPQIGQWLAREAARGLAKVAGRKPPPPYTPAFNQGVAHFLLHAGGWLAGRAALWQSTHIAPWFRTLG